jgi:tRNA (guanine9-N1)-methyltransferase
VRAPFGARVVVDLGFDDRMIEKVRGACWICAAPADAGRQEIKSLTAQLSYVYAAQRRADTPFAGVLFSQLDGRTRARMEGLNDGSFKRWEGCEWWADGYDALWAPDADPRPEGAGLAADGKPGKDETAVTGASAAGKARASAPQASVVYLTADSPHELSELSPDETYIIGGVCDRNRYKVHPCHHPVFIARLEF